MYAYFGWGGSHKAKAVAPPRKAAAAAKERWAEVASGAGDEVEDRIREVDETIEGATS